MEKISHGELAQMSAVHKETPMNRITLNEYVKMIRIENLMTQDDMAKATHFHSSMISLMESGKRKVSWAYVWKLYEMGLIPKVEGLADYRNEYEKRGKKK